MADEKKKPKAEIFRTPKGTLKYPRLNEPDMGTKEYPKEGGEYNTKLILSGDAAEKLKKILKPLHEAAIEAGRVAYNKKAKDKREKKPFVENDFCTTVYGEDEEPTGEFEFSFKMKASGKNKETGKEWKRQCPLFDSKGLPLPKKVQVWGGSEAEIAFSTRPYFIDGSHAAGLSLALEAVIVRDLVQGGGAKSASAYGFEADEDGFTYEPDPEDDTSDDTDSDTAAADEDTDF